MRPDLISISTEFTDPFLRDEDPLVRAYALLISGAYKLRGTIPAVSALKDDSSMVKLYGDGGFVSLSIGELAAKIYDSLSEEEN